MYFNIVHARTASVTDDDTDSAPTAKRLWCAQIKQRAPARSSLLPRLCYNNVASHSGCLLTLTTKPPHYG
jgi:hypothetical protein